MNNVCKVCIACRVAAELQDKLISYGWDVCSVSGCGGCYVLPDDRVRVSRSRYKAKFIRLQSSEFFHILREKLGWDLPHIAKPTSVELP